MKITFLKVLLLSCSIGTLNAQINSITLKPGPNPGQDANIARNTGANCSDWVNSNDGNSPELASSAWTYRSNHFCDTGIIRSLIRFAQLNTAVPSGSFVTNARLRLFGTDTSGNYGNTGHPNSPYATDNQITISRITSDWNENTVTWNSAPTTTAVNRITSPASTTRWNWNYENGSADLRAMVQHMVSNPSENFGFMLQLENETIYRAMLFASSDHTNRRLWPELEVEYIRCYPHFTIGTSSLSNGIYSFTSPINHPSATHNWTVFGPNNYYDELDTLPSVSTVFNQPGTYRICHNLYLPDTKCATCIDICTNGLVGGQSSNPLPPGTPDSYINESSKGDDLNVAPNPTEDNWTVSFSSRDAGTGTAAVADMLNRKVTDMTFEITPGKNEIRIEGVNLAPGQYILTLSINGKQSNTKLVKY